MTYSPQSNFELRDMWTKLSFLLAVCFWAVQVAAQVPNGRDIMAQTRALFEENAFEALDQLAEEYISSEARTFNGSLRLEFLYWGIYEDFSGDVEDGAFWQNLDEKTMAYMLERPNSSTANILRAEYYRKLAWAYRGDRRPRDVSREYWSLYRENMALAESVLANSGKPFKDNPHWYAEALTVRGGISARSSGFFSLLNEAMTKHPNYDPIYYAAVVFLEKRWSGDPLIVERFARSAANYTNETYGASMYAQLYIRLWEGYFPQTNLFLFLQPDWALMKQGMLDTLERYPTEWNMQVFAHIACMKQDYQFMDLMFGQIQTAPIAEIWNDQFKFESCSNTELRPMTEEDLIIRTAQNTLLMVLLALGYTPRPR